MNTIVSQSAFAEADERALDRAVRRLPGYWTWDYAPHAAGPDTITAIISPPWNPGLEAFHVFHHPGDVKPFGLESGLEPRASGRYAALDHLLRGVRAIVMGDPIEREDPVPGSDPVRPRRKSAKGHPPAQPNPYDLTATDCGEIEAVLDAWHDAGRCALSNVDGPPGYLFSSWDDRFPAFIIEREGTRIRLKDNITFGLMWGATGTFSSVRPALEAVRCVLDGQLSSADPEVEAMFERYRAAISADWREAATDQEDVDAEEAA